MRSLLAATALVSVALLSGCVTGGVAAVPTTSATPNEPVVPDTADGKACSAWYEAEVGMLSAVSAIQVSGTSNTLANAFNRGRNELLAAYTAARDSAENADLKAAFDTGLNTDAKLYFETNSATDADFQAALQSVQNVIVACTAAGFDSSGLFGSSK